VRKRVLAAIERIVNAEAAASGAPRPPEITTLDHYPLNVNDAEAASRVVDAFRRHFPAERVRICATKSMRSGNGFLIYWGDRSKALLQRCGSLKLIRLAAS
jgi:metal-dependent amidase/aminoacylase/carboxypeptidase family protein